MSLALIGQVTDFTDSFSCFSLGIIGFVCLVAYFFFLPRRSDLAQVLASSMIFVTVVEAALVGLFAGAITMSVGGHRQARSWPERSWACSGSSRRPCSASAITARSGARTCPCSRARHPGPADLPSPADHHRPADRPVLAQPRGRAPEADSGYRE
ncbi:hypothetical protein [Herbiconiux daphne]|uniref:Uncharacterized protein n=1 Tax=Herbiconiux daphne TaxID=2970914 RepID=A0ABT2H5C2_9MICO|nr:hypothetical protein [Herbiconiux daphne]MCS5735109.1 hypothetical protein [Herbiconiux daphne]